MTLSTDTFCFFFFLLPSFSFHKILSLSLSLCLLRLLSPQKGTRKFKAFTNTSYAELEKATTHVEVGLKFLERDQETLNAKRKQLALGISQIINLDAIQTYILIHKYESCHSGQGGAAAGKGSSEEDAGIAFKILDFYFQERQALLECLSEILRNELREDPDVKSLQVRELMGKVDDGVVERALSSLNASMSYLPSHQFHPNYQETSETNGCLGRCPSKTIEAGLENYWTDQQTLEQVLLMQQIFLFYYLEENMPRRELLRNFMTFLCSMQPGSFGSSLSEIAVRNMHSILNTSVFVFIEMLDVDGLLEMIATNASDQLVDLSKWSTLDLTSLEIEKVSQPHLTLVWSVFQQLKHVLSPQQEKLAYSPDQVAVKSISQGALDRIIFALRDEVIHSSTDSTAFHSVLKNFVSSLLVAFELTPKRLPSDMLEALTKIFALSVSGEPILVEQFWNEEYLLDQPIRNFLGECQQLFPSLPTPYMRLLQALCEAVDETNANLVNDKVLSHFRDLKSLSVFHSPSDLMDATSEIHIRHQVQKLQLQMGRQVRIVKNCVYQIPDCPGLFIDDKVVGNVLEYYQDGRDDSESRYLVSWLVDIDGYFLILSRLHSFSISEEMISKAEEIQLSFKLLSSVLANSMDHWEELMAVNIDDNEIRLLDVAAVIFERHRSMLAHTTNEEAGVCLSVLSSCLNLAIAVSTCDPKLVANWLRKVVGGSGVMSGSILSDPSQCIPAIAGIYRKEVSMGSFDFTITFLKLVNSLAEKVVFGPDSILYLYFATFEILSNIQTVTFHNRHQQIDLVGSALSLIQNSLRIYELLQDMRRVIDVCPVKDFDWSTNGSSYTSDIESFLRNKFSLSIVMRSALVLLEASGAEAMHMKGKNLLASKMETSILSAGKVLLRLLALSDRTDLEQDILSCIASNFKTNGSQTLAKVVTSYTEYQFDLKVRQLAFDLLKGMVKLAAELDTTSILQCCHPYLLTSDDSSKFLQMLAASLAEESLLGTPDLFTSTIQFLTFLIQIKYPFPPVMIPGYESGGKKSSSLSGWLLSLSQCLVNDECRSKQPAAFSSLMEFLDSAWISGLSFITQGILDNAASWEKLEELASNTQQWNSLDAEWTFKFSDFSQDFFCKIHASALNIVAHEFFVCCRGFSIDEGRASSMKRWVGDNILQIILEFGRIKFDVRTRLRLQRKLRGVLVECSSISSVFSHQGIRSILKFAEENIPRDTFRGDEPFDNALDVRMEELNQRALAAFPLERLFLCCLEADKPLQSMWLHEYKPLKVDKFAAEFSVLFQNDIVTEKIQAIQSLMTKLNAHSQVEAAAISFSNAVSSIAYVVKEQKQANVGLLNLSEFLNVSVNNLNISLDELTNHEECTNLFTPLVPVEELMLAFNKALVQTCSTAITIGLDHDLLDDGWIQDIFYVDGKSDEWMHNWLTFLSSSPQGMKKSGVEMSIKILSLLRMLYSNLGEAGGMVSIGMETILKSFSLACSFCHSRKDLKLSSLLVIKCILDDWLSPKMSQGDWVPLLEGSPAKKELCRLGDELYPSELRSMLLVTAAAIAETDAGASTLIDWWKEYGTFRQLIKYASFLVSDGNRKSDEWCSWLELVSTLLHVCSDMTSSSDGIDALRVFASALADELYPYIVGILSSFVNHERNLDLGELVIVKHIAFLLYALSKFAGRWNLTLPKSMIDVQHSVVLFLVYAAQPALKPYFSVESHVSDEKDAKLCSIDGDFTVLEGWFAAVRSEVVDREKAARGRPALAVNSLKKSPPRVQIGTNQYCFRVAHTMYINVCYFLEFLLISLPAENMLLSNESFNDSFIVSLIGIQIQSIHISSGLCHVLAEHPKHGELLELFCRILNLSTFVQEVVFKSYLGTDKHGRNSWRLMSNLTAAYALLKNSMENLLAKVDLSGIDHGTQNAIGKMLDSLKAGGEKWAGTLSSEEALLTTTSTNF